MRYGLPLWYSLSRETQEKLTPMLDDPASIPPCEWREWYPDIIAIGEGDITHLIFPDDFDYDSFMSNRPRPARVK